MNYHLATAQSLMQELAVQCPQGFTRGYPQLQLVVVNAQASTQLLKAML